MEKSGNFRKGKTGVGKNGKKLEKTKKNIEN